MSSSQHFLLTTVVEASVWRSTHVEWLATAHDTLRRRARQRGLSLTADPEHTIEILAGATRLRITVSADGTPSRPVE